VGGATLAVCVRVTPSVTTCEPSSESSGRRHAFASPVCIFPAASAREISTVHAPQPPSPQPTFVPVSASVSRKYAASVVCGSTPSPALTVCAAPLTLNVIEPAPEARGRSAAHPSCTGAARCGASGGPGVCGGGAWCLRVCTPGTTPCSGDCCGWWKHDCLGSAIEIWVWARLCRLSLGGGHE